MALFVDTVLISVEIPIMQHSSRIFAPLNNNKPSDMRYSVDHIDNTATLMIHEERLDSITSSEFKGELVVLCRSGIEVLFIDMSQIVYCDSAGLGAMLLAHREMKASGGYSIIVGLTPTVKSLIELAHLDQVLYIYDTREEAMADLTREEEEGEG